MEELTAKENPEEPIRGEIYSSERLELYAAYLAEKLEVTTEPSDTYWFLPRVEENSEILIKAYQKFTHTIQKNKTIPPAGEWLVENFHIVEEQIREIREDLPKGFYTELPKLIAGDLKGYPRIYAPSLTLIAHLDSHLDKNIIESFIKAYQKVSPLLSRELWALPITLRIVLVENLRRLIVRVTQIEEIKEKIDRLSDQLLKEEVPPDKLQDEIKKHLGHSNYADCACIAQLSRRLRDQDLDTFLIYKCLNDYLADKELAIEDIIHKDHLQQSATQITVGNIITSMRLLSNINWNEFFTNVSLMEEVLLGDPADAYRFMDFDSRDSYRHIVEKISKRTGIDELDIARKVTQFAKDAILEKVSDKRASHVGYYLVDDGLATFEKEVGYVPTPKEKVKKAILNHPSFFYFGVLVLLISIILTPFFYLFYQSQVSLISSFFILMVVLIPISDVGLNLLNLICSLVLKPRVLPKLDFKYGIPDDVKAFVVIPTIFNNTNSVEILLERLEIHYLSNQEPNLYFSLLSDFTDADSESLPSDMELLEFARKGISELNSKYGHRERPRFYLFHRHREWNPKENTWMGRERKRGKLHEFNRFLRGEENTAFIEAPEYSDFFSDIKYVITLDSDTRMPHGVAKRLLGTIAHPLNRPILDSSKRIVTKGYGILQPRITISPESSTRSTFASIFSGHTGIDPYTTAISDNYQDLFGEGLYTGKGLYVVDTFEQALKGRAPENAILSHDLFEGNFARAALVSDIELLDDYPSHYDTYSKRLHRWTRGDWQILRWLFPKVPKSSGEYEANVLPMVSRWKIFDNLRRSLIAPTTLLWLVLGWFVFPGSSLLWTLSAILLLFFPPYAHATNGLLLRGENTSWSDHIKGVAGDFISNSLQVLLVIIFLPHQAYLQIDAILRTIYRIFISKKQLLEWTTAAEAESKMISEKSFSTNIFLPVEIFSISLVYLFLTTRDPSWIIASPFLLIWISSPLIINWLSRIKKPEEHDFSIQQINHLRSLTRRTWHFFEVFLSSGDNWLIPDNYQEDPEPAIAHRTSPTNIGGQLLSITSAFDLGHICTLKLIEIMENSLNSMVKLERAHGHFYNWYDTQTLKPLHPLYISTVDSGNLAGHLITSKQACLDIIGRPILEQRLIEGLFDTLHLEKDELKNIFLPETEKLRKKLRMFLEDHQDARPHSPSDWHEFLEGTVAFLEEMDLVISELTVKHGKNSIRKLSIWNTSALKMARSAKKQLLTFTPWIICEEFNLKNELKKHLPQLMPEWKEISVQLNRIPTLNEAPDFWNSIMEKLQRFYNNARKHESSGLPGKLDQYFQEMKFAVEKGIASCSENIEKLRSIALHCNNFAMEMDFSILFDHERKIFVIGYNAAEGQLDNSYYDLLASEARLASFIAISKGDIPEEHWFHLGRQMTSVQSKRVLISWSASMFEYLMPLLVMKNFENTLLNETYKSVVSCQIDYGKKLDLPWGISESAYNARDLQLQYQYGPFGVPGMGLKYGLGDTKVIAPYATALAALIEPHKSLENLKALTKLGTLTEFGFYESIDYTTSRIPPELKMVIIKSFMAHHQAMIYTSLNNLINANISQTRFHNDPVIKSSTLLLQERVPRAVALAPNRAQKLIVHAEKTEEKVDVRRFEKPFFSYPQVQVLSNGEYTVMISTTGGGFSRCNEFAVSRWNEDVTLDNWGQFIYIRDKLDDKIWSAAYQPLGVHPESYEVVFTEHKAEFWRRDGSFLTHMEVIVSPEDNVELRRITITSSSPRNRKIDLTSYLEPVLAHPNDDVAHPVFSKLFVQTEFIKSKDALLATRRKRSEEDVEIWGFHVVTIDGNKYAPVEYETDRSIFIGRGQSINNPIAIENNQSLSNTTGNVLDPIFALRTHIEMDAYATVQICFSTGMTNSRDEALRLIDQYHDIHSFNRENGLSWTHAQVELRHLNIKYNEANLYQMLAGVILYSTPVLRPVADDLSLNMLPQSVLWKFGVSGDNPIVLLHVKGQRDINLIRQLLHAHEYLRHKKIILDLIVLNDEKSSYRNNIQDEIMRQINMLGSETHMNQGGGIFLFRTNDLKEDEKILLRFSARVLIDSSRGTLEEQLGRIKQRIKEPALKVFPLDISSRQEELPLPVPKLEFFNGLGGFGKDGREYTIILDKEKNTPLPWINVIANEKEFGFIISETGAGYTWSENSRENRLTPWSNDPVRDPSGEAIYIRDEQSGSVWSPTPWPIRDASPYHISHGQGYSRFEHNSHGLSHELTYFVPLNEKVKVGYLKLKNLSRNKKKLTITHYVEWVLGFHKSKSSHYIRTTKSSQKGVLLAQNSFNDEYHDKIAFSALSGHIRSFTCDRREFLGHNGSYHSPLGMSKDRFSNRVSTGKDPCSVIQSALEIEPMEEKTIILLIGQSDDQNQIENLVDLFFNKNHIEKSLDEVKRFWDDHLKSIQIKTPSREFDIMMNSWLPYQALVCRYWARSAFYQSGGAYGFRDQLQDVMSMVHSKPEIARKHILEAASHQFLEGDVQHWWHPPTNRGVRTHFSDDLLWLPYVVSHYISNLGDDEILNQEVSYLEGPEVPQDREDIYIVPEISQQKGTLYEHCLKAIEHSLKKKGAHNLPLMGCGDWNDGMNKVGAEGRGESIWVAQFLIVILKDFIPICEKRGDIEKANSFRNHQKELLEAISSNGWDGKWYRRAFYDNGEPMGSTSSEECQIDSLVQSWAVLAGLGDKEHHMNIMNEVDKNLILREEKMILLFTPPFDRSHLNPGYIKGYPPGIRENGGQYTHAAIWVAMAYAKIGEYDRAFEVLSILNPIQHSKSSEEVQTYKVEPYVISADVYFHPEHTGRGGWSWYTGASGWFYQAGLEVLGFKRKGDSLKLSPHIPHQWKEYEFNYTYGSSNYKITVENPHQLSAGQITISLDGSPLREQVVSLADDGAVHEVKVRIEHEAVETQSGHV